MDIIELNREYLSDIERYPYEVAVSTDKGMQKEINEDAVVEDKLPGGIQFVIVADGMGGLKKAKLAAFLATMETRNQLIKEVVEPPETV